MPRVCSRWVPGWPLRLLLLAHPALLALPQLVTAELAQDAGLHTQTSDSMRVVLAAKASSAALLASAVAAQPTQRFALYSSIASSLGSAGQSVYAVANAALDAAAEDARAKVGMEDDSFARALIAMCRVHKRSPCLCCVQGNATVSVAWGAWGGMGMAASNTALEARLLQLGIASLRPAVGLAILEVTLSSLAAQSTSLAAGLVWERILVAGRQYLAFYAEFAAGRAAAWSPQAVAPPQLAVVGSARVHGANMPLASGSGSRVAQQDVAALVMAIVDQALGRSLSADEPLVAAGLDSIGAV